MPNGATFNTTTGLLAWTPAASRIGTTVYFTTTATDPSGAKSTQRWGVAVKAANNIPVINSTAPTSVVIGQKYRYDVNATDVDNDPLTYSLVNSPSGMTIDANGRVEWITTNATTGTYAVRIAVTDGRSAPVEQPYNLTVTPDSVAPTVQIVTDRSTVRIGETVGIQVYVLDNIAVASRTLTLTTRSYLGTTNTINRALPLLANGTIQRKIEAGMLGAGIDTFGELSFAATATDGAGNIGTATPVSITVPNPADQRPPVADILNNDQLTISEPIAFRSDSASVWIMCKS